MRGTHLRATVAVGLFGLCGLLAACVPPLPNPGPTTTTTTTTTSTSTSTTSTTTTVQPGALEITTTSLPYGIVGRPYSVTLTSTGGVAPIEWLTSSFLPAGFDLSTDGVLSGVAAGELEFELHAFARDAAGTMVDAQLHLGVYTAGTGPVPTEVPKIEGNLQWGSLAPVVPGTLPHWYGYQTSESTGDTAPLATRQVGGFTTYVGHSDPSSASTGFDHISVDPTGRFVAVSRFPLSSSPPLDVIDTHTGVTVYTSPPPEGVSGWGQEGAFSPDGRYLAVLHTSYGFIGTLDFVDTATWTVTRTTAGSGEPALQGAGGFGSTRISIVWSPDSTRVVMPMTWSIFSADPVPPMVVLSVATVGATTVPSSDGCFPQDWAVTDRILAICYESNNASRMVEARTYPVPVPGGEERFNTILAGRQCSNVNVCAPSDDQLPMQALFSPDGSHIVMASSDQLDDGLGYELPVILQGALDENAPEVDVLTEPLTAVRLLGWSDSAHPWATS